MSKINICGIRYDNIIINDIKNIINKTSESFPFFIVTPNVDFIVRANRDEHFKKIINSADLSLCDSAVVFFSSYLLKSKLKSKITGYDAMEFLLNDANLKKEHIFLLGSTDNKLSRAISNIKVKYPNIGIAGIQNGYFNEADSKNIILRINESSAKYLFIGMGSPKQEYWVDKNKKLLNVKYIICIGGLFDIYSDAIKRAPLLFQIIGMEWFWRLINDPKRLWKRYLLEDIQYFRMFARQLFSKERRNG